MPAEVVATGAEGAAAPVERAAGAATAARVEDAEVEAEEAATVERVEDAVEAEEAATVERVEDAAEEAAVVARS